MRDVEQGLTHQYVALGYLVLIMLGFLGRAARCLNTHLAQGGQESVPGIEAVSGATSADAGLVCFQEHLAGCFISRSFDKSLDRI